MFVDKVRKNAITKEAALALVENADLYARLGLTSQATDAEIRQNGRRILALLHPDRQGSEHPSRKDAICESFKRAAEAYETLSDREKRQQYDSSISPRGRARTENPEVKPGRAAPKQSPEHCWGAAAFSKEAADVAWARAYCGSLGIQPGEQGAILAAQRIFEQDSGAGASAVLYSQLVRAARILGVATLEDFKQSPDLAVAIQYAARRMWEHPGSHTPLLFQQFLARIQCTHDPLVISRHVRDRAIEYGLRMWREVSSLACGTSPFLELSFKSLVDYLAPFGGPTAKDFSDEKEMQAHVRRLAAGIKEQASSRVYREMCERNFSAMCGRLGLANTL
jgi:hypothetical protein